MLKRLRRVVAVLVAVGGWYVWLPPRAYVLPATRGVNTPVRGAIHVHSARSDGTGTMEQIASAAARAGLQFVIVTDHGDATREPDTPSYHSGVLCIDGVEVSTTGGHLVALGLPRSPYPVAGNPRDVIADVSRMGGFAVVAHPTSSRSGLSWTDWDVGFGGLEWLNADSEWRNENAWSLARFLLTFPARRAEALATLLDRPASLDRWDVITRSRRVVAVAAADAHARVGLRSAGEPYGADRSLPLPSYESVFRTFSVAIPGVTLSGEAGADATAVLRALREGRVYSTIDALGGPATLSISGSSGPHVAEPGQALTVDGPITLKVSAPVPPGAFVVLLKDGDELTRRGGGRLEYVGPPARGAYRVEIRLPTAPGRPPVPWIVSNPIYVDYPAQELPLQERRGPTTSFPIADDPLSLMMWRVEHSESSAGAIDGARTLSGSEVRFRWALAGTRSESPFVAMVMPAEGLETYDRLTFVSRASRPMRVSVELRRPAGSSGERWHRSVYLDPTPREVTVFFDDMTAWDGAGELRPVLQEVDSVLFVVDTLNTALGSSGQVWFDEVRYAR